MEDGWTQTMAPQEPAPFEVGGAVGVEGGVNIDGTPMRLVTVVTVGIILLVLINQGRIRFHVTG